MTGLPSRGVARDLPRRWGRCHRRQGREALRLARASPVAGGVGRGDVQSSHPLYFGGT